MKAAKIIITALIIISATWIGYKILPAVQIGYGELLGAIFAFIPTILLLILSARIYKSITPQIISLFVVVGPPDKPIQDFILSLKEYLNATIRFKNKMRDSIAFLDSKIYSSEPGIPLELKNKMIAMKNRFIQLEKEAGEKELRLSMLVNDMEEDFKPTDEQFTRAINELFTK